jgi:1-acyl-sn-glycerol-3-phosphate acyltransferase
VQEVAVNRKSEIGNQKSNGALSQAISLDPATLDARTLALASGSAAIVTLTAIVLLPVGALTLFRARRLYSWFARLACRAILRMYGITVRIHQAAPFPQTQTIYISNHTSTLDLFVLVSLGLPNCRFFLSGFLKKIVPLGVISGMMGTFFTVAQDHPAERTRIFQRAERILGRTRESVYLSPEGARITTGQVGHFNKGAFHLATNLHVPIVPFFIAIPPGMDPGRGIDARPGVIDVLVMPTIDTRNWTLADLERNKEDVRDQFVTMHAEQRHAA